MKSFRFVALSLFVLCCLLGTSSWAQEKSNNNQNQENEQTKAESEKSVKPGINSSFKDPELNVEQFVNRFELESREVYSARKEILAACSVKPGMYIADVGAGTGLFTRLFAEAVGQQGWVYAVDIAPRFVEHITKETTDSGLQNVTATLCNDRDIRLPPNSVDLVFVCDTYHHFEFPQSTLKSIMKSLRPGGRLVVIDFERIEGKSRPWLLGHVRAGKEVFRAEIQDAGFVLEEEKRLPGLKENYFLIFKNSK